MKHWLFLSLLFVGVLALTLTVTDSSYAARMGGGRSFGSSPTMRTPTAAPRPQSAPIQRQQPMASPTTAPRPNTGMGGMGGLFGGLLAGTFLGAMLGGGGGAAGAGGGGGAGFLLNLILFGALAYFGYKLYRRFTASHQGQDPTYQQANPYSQNPYDQPQANDYRDTSWDTQSYGSSSNTFGAPNVPQGFNVDEFLQGAKAAYVRMQASWDQRDLDDISQFATPAVMSVLREQLRDDPNPSHTEIININAQLMGVSQQGGIERAQVYFDVLMRENPNQVRPEPAQEYWHFVRTLPDGSWKLDGIQQTY